MFLSGVVLIRLPQAVRVQHQSRADEPAALLAEWVRHAGVKPTVRTGNGWPPGSVPVEVASIRDSAKGSNISMPIRVPSGEEVAEQGALRLSGPV